MHRTVPQIGRECQAEDSRRRGIPEREQRVGGDASLGHDSVGKVAPPKRHRVAFAGVRASDRGVEQCLG